MLSQFQKHINTHFPDLKNQQVGVAISGGVDSIVLAHLLNESGVSIALLHCNFNLRGFASDGDQAFVKRLADAWKVPFVTTEFNTKAYAEINKTSIQIAARELRYAWFTKMANIHKLDVVTTGHHADDNLETFLINLTRGTGLEGLTGIPKVNGLYVRPLLLFSKQDILNYAQSAGLQWREDASNVDTKYVRNKIRHHAIPVLKEIQPQLLKNVGQTLTYLQQSQDLVSTYVKEKQQFFFEEDTTTNGYRIVVDKLLKEPHLELVLFESLKGYGFTAWEDIKKLLHAQSGKKVVSPTHTVLKNREHILVYPNAAAEETTEYIIQEKAKHLSLTNGILHIEKKTLNKQEETSALSIYIDNDSVEYPLVVRKWQKGDYFYPTGMQGKKKLSKYFKDEKYALPEKENTWLLCSKNEIIWVIGKRADRRFQSTPKTINSIKITYEITS